MKFLFFFFGERKGKKKKREKTKEKGNKKGEKVVETYLVGMVQYLFHSSIQARSTYPTHDQLIANKE